MIIEVNDSLIKLIQTIEERERASVDYDLNFGWAYSEDGHGATGESYYNHPHAEYDLYVSKTGTVTAQKRELDKWSNEGWGTDPLDSDYESDEDEE